MPVEGRKTSPAAWERSRSRPGTAANSLANRQVARLTGNSSRRCSRVPISTSLAGSSRPAITPRRASSAPRSCPATIARGPPTSRAERADDLGQPLAACTGGAADPRSRRGAADRAARPGSAPTAARRSAPIRGARARASAAGRSPVRCRSPGRRRGRRRRGGTAAVARLPIVSEKRIYACIDRVHVRKRHRRRVPSTRPRSRPSASPVARSTARERVAALRARRRPRASRSGSRSRWRRAPTPRRRRSRACSTSCTGSPGVSYYKAAAPPAVACETGAPPPATAALLESLYSEGLGEFAVVNELGGASRAVVPRESGTAPRRARRPRARSERASSSPSAAARTPRSRSRSPGARVCGRPSSRSAIHRRSPGPSRVSGPAAAARHADRSTPSCSTCNAAGRAQRSRPGDRDRQLRRAADRRAQRRDAVALANERSASSPNTIWRGVPINHQFSKSAARRAAARGGGRRGPGRARGSSRSCAPPQSSRSRARSRGCPPTTRRSRAATASSASTRRRGRDSWCCDCDKCRFVFLILAPFLEPAQLTAIFGADLLADDAPVRRVRDAHRDRRATSRSSASARRSRVRPRSGCSPATRAGATTPSCAGWQREVLPRFNAADVDPRRTARAQRRPRRPRRADRLGSCASRSLTAAPSPSGASARRRARSRATSRSRLPARPPRRGRRRQPGARSRAAAARGPEPRAAPASSPARRRAQELRDVDVLVRSPGVSIHKPELEALRRARGHRHDRDRLSGSTSARAST